MSITFNQWVLFFTTLLLVVALGRVVHARRLLQGAALSSVWGWAVAALSAWMAATLLAALRGEDAWVDQATYLACVLSLCPLIAVLGARRPTSRVWDVFIILPLVAVLGWPAATVWRRFPELSPLQLEGPVMMGFALILLMGVGNYLGTRAGWGTFFVGVGVCLALAPFSTLFAASSNAALSWRTAAGLAIAAGSLSILSQARRPDGDADPFRRAWADFRNLFGLVWSIRIQERLNAQAEKESAPWRVGPEGLEWLVSASENDRSQAELRLNTLLRWHWRRFVDEEWINRRLPPLSAAAPCGTPSAPSRPSPRPTETSV